MYNQGFAISSEITDSRKAMKTGLSLLFQAGHRPTAREVWRHALAITEKPGIAFANEPDPETEWLELIYMGLSFDCNGLAPGSAYKIDPPLQALGVDQELAGQGVEAIWLTMGPHLSESGHLLPVIRALAALGSLLATLDDVQAVVWNPAGSWMEPGYFRKVVSDWIAGGAFPSLGFASLLRQTDGTILSHGLTTFVGQELLLEPKAGVSAGDAARLAMRLIDELVYSGPLAEAAVYSGPSDEELHAQPDSANGLIRVKWVA
jgi:hypothetical protein